MDLPLIKPLGVYESNGRDGDSKQPAVTSTQRACPSSVGGGSKYSGHYLSSLVQVTIYRLLILLINTVFRSRAKQVVEGSPELRIE